MTREEKIELLNKLLEIEGKNDIGNLTRAERGEFQQWINDAIEQESCDKCVYSTKDGCQYDDITEAIPPFETCEDTIMTLDEAIKHAEEVAEEKDMQAGFDTDCLCYQMSNAERNQCKKCADEHRQLAEWLKDYKRLKEQEPCDDAISRQAVLDKIENSQSSFKNGFACGFFIEKIIDLPPVNPKEPKTGHWKPYLKEGLRYQCSVCDSRFATPWGYCPSCGAKMEESEASE